MRQLSSLTGLRGVAALWVMLYHGSLLGPALGARWLGRLDLLHAGWIGVDLFFVLSGFILMWTHGAEFVRPSPAGVRRFAALRLLRVYPLSLAVLALIALLAVLDPVFVAAIRAKGPDNLSAGAFLRTALLATRWIGGTGGDWNQPVWSLSAELVGYAAFPLLAWSLARRSLGPSLIVAGTALGLLAGFQLAAGIVGLNTIDQVSALVRMGCGFTAGVAACRMRQTLPEAAARWAPAVALGCCLVLLAAIQAKAGFILAPALFAGLILALSFQSGAVDRALAARPILWLGRISFPLYLLHLTPLNWMIAHLGPARLGELAATGLLLAYGAACLGCANLLHRLVEQPAHRWARRGFPGPVARARLAAG